MGNEHPKPRALRVDEEQTHPCRQCPIKAQAAASVGRTGPSLDYTKKRALDDPFPGKEKGASASATLLCACSVVLIKSHRKNQALSWDPVGFQLE